MCNGCEENLSVTMTPGGLLCNGCEELEDAPLHPDLEAKLRLEMSDERAEEWRDGRTQCQH